MKAFAQNLGVVGVSVVVALYSFEAFHQAAAYREQRANTQVDGRSVTHRTVVLEHMIAGDEYAGFPDESV